MKPLARFTTVLLSITFITFSIPSIATAAPQEITLTAPSHRLITGQFIDDALASEIAAVGSLGKELFSEPLSPNSQIVWRIDPALVEDVQAMALGYKLVDGTEGFGKDFAQTWLDRLKAITANSRVIAIAYGNPSGYWIKRLTPHEQNYLLVSSQRRLALDLNRPVEPSVGYINNSYFKLPGYVVQSVQAGYKTIQSNALYLDPLKLESYRLSITRIFNQKLTTSHRARLIYDLNDAVATISQSIRTAPGRFTITSAKQSLPITVINDFSNSAKINLVINSINERMIVGDIKNLTIAGKSKLQVLVPVQVLTSGQSGFSISIENLKGEALGDTTQYPINLKVISPVATWVTTGAAITLFFAVLLQSFRRLKRKRKNEH